jgi:hypothetical protein
MVLDNTTMYNVPASNLVDLHGNYVNLTLDENDMDFLYTYCLRVSPENSLINALFSFYKKTFIAYQRNLGRQRADAHDHMKSFRLFLLNLRNMGAANLKMYLGEQSTEVRNLLLTDKGSADFDIIFFWPPLNNLVYAYRCAYVYGIDVGCNWKKGNPRVYSAKTVTFHEMAMQRNVKDCIFLASDVQNERNEVSREFFQPMFFFRLTFTSGKILYRMHRFLNICIRYK